MQVCRGWFGAVSTAVLLFSTGCAAGRNLQSGQPAPMSAPVLVFYDEGAKLFQEKDFQRAREKYQAALGQAQASGDAPGIGLSLAGYRSSQQALKEYDQAFESFKAALPYLKGSQNVAAEALTFAAIGEVQIQLGQDARAIEAFQQALIIAENLLEKASDQDKLLILTHREKVLLLQSSSIRKARKLYRVSQELPRCGERLQENRKCRTGKCGALGWRRVRRKMAT